MNDCPTSEFDKDLISVVVIGAVCFVVSAVITLTSVYLIENLSRVSGVVAYFGMHVIAGLWPLTIKPKE